MKFHGRFEFARLIPPMLDHRGKRGGKYSEKCSFKMQGKRIGKKHKKTGSGSCGNKKTQLEKRGLKKGGNIWRY
jgi:hypothetical protein